MKVFYLHLAGNNGQSYHFKILVPAVAAGAIIGKGGETIAQLQKDTNARVKMSKANDFYPGQYSYKFCIFCAFVYRFSQFIRFYKLLKRQPLIDYFFSIQALLKGFVLFLGVLTVSFEFTNSLWRRSKRNPTPTLRLPLTLTTNSRRREKNRYQMIDSSFDSISKLLGITFR